ncbi:MAG: Asp-tRNA(Asn)/Glu-tRNA(Gln) amidotransferase subunit GatC [candidate division WOR-3 bacterium]|nr:Asp-tRNA(Asn)/Glu-tRNA(Gln) amidotransferase subunit GatC [candidate division WOR-3 bacterium]
MITLQDIEKIARLARIGLQSDEIISLTEDIENIINYFQKLKELSLEEVLPMTHTVEKTLELRPDIVQESKLSIDKFPYLKFHYFYVPAVIE